MRRILLVAAVATLLVLAGCVGEPEDGESFDDSVDGLGDESGAGPDDATEATPADDGDDSDAPDDASDETADSSGPPAGELEIHHIDVGQADSTLIIAPSGESILVDTGDWRDDGESVIDYLEVHGIESVDHLVATHAHADHIGGHAAVIEHFEETGEGIGAAYDSGVAHGTQTYENYLDAIETHEVDLFEVEEGDELPLEDDDLTVTVLNPPANDSGTDLHYNSVVLAIEFGEFRYLTTGDGEEDAESRLLAEWSHELDADVYQAGHHGSSTSSSEAFLDAVSPEIAVISSDFDSQYGHPHDEVLERFDEHDVETYWTGVHGDVVFSTGGESDDIEIVVEHEETTDPLELRDMKPEDDDQSHGNLVDGLSTTLTASATADTVEGSAG